MGFDYDELAARQEQQSNMWASYSDLFMVLSMVFLLLYVFTSLRSGTNNIKNNLEYQQLAKEADGLKQQIKVYETLKNEYVKEQATKSELDTYNELMGKLDLLQEEAQTESDALRRKAQENIEKKDALNKYQKIVKNIINANMVAQQRIKKREKIIRKKDDTIKEKKEIIAKNMKVIEQKKDEIKDLNVTIEQKQSQIIANNEKIDEINFELEDKIDQMKKQREESIKAIQAIEKQTEQEKEQQRMRVIAERSKFRARIANLKVQSQERIDALSDQNKFVEKQLNRVELKLASANNRLTDAEKEIKKQEEKRRQVTAKLEQVSEENKEISGELEKTKEDTVELSSQLEKEQKEREAVRQRLEATRAQQEQLKQELKNTESGYKEKVTTLTKEFKQKLAKERAKATARKDLVKQIRQNFKQAGVKAKINERTGEVILEFGDEYFDTGRSVLKNNMKSILQKSVPAYAKSLFQKQNIAKKIANVEIIGFASPTYQGKFVDPDSLDEKDQKATEYNLDLSYQRARSIFTYIFDKKNMSFKDQQQLRNIIKVSSKGYLDFAKDLKSDRKTASAVSSKEFCKSVDCQKFQRVIIKFNLKN